MKNKQLSLLLATVLTSSISIAEVEIEVSGQAVFEASKYLDNYDGKIAGNDSLEPHGKDWFKNSADLRVYIDGDTDDILEGSTFHVELNGYANPLGSGASFGNNYNEAYTQRDILREAYADVEYNDWQLRLGKQQVVWGTADGMKLLDMINPTDYTEMAQNQMEDSRIPVWMINGETDLENGTSLQVVLSQPKENVFSGLNRRIDQKVRGNGARLTKWKKEDGSSTGAVPIQYIDLIDASHDEGQFTLMRGPSSITGSYDGFLNIVPDMGTVAALFGEAFADFEVGTDNDITTSFKIGGLGRIDNNPFDQFSVGEFLGGKNDVDSNGDIIHSNFGAFSDRLRAYDSNNYANGFGDMNFAKYVDNMYGDGSWATSQAKADGVRATFATGTDENIIQDAIQAQVAIDSTDWNQYTIEGEKALGSFYTSNFASNLFDRGLDGTTDTAGVFSGDQRDSAFEYMGKTTFETFDAFVNAKSQYTTRKMPKSTDLDFAIRNKGTTEDGQNWQFAYSFGYDKNPIIDLAWKNNVGQTLTVEYEDATLSNGDPTKTLTLVDIDGNTYGGAAQDAAVTALGVNATEEEIQTAINSKAPILEFAVKTTPIHSLGAATDFSIETEALGTVVIRGEALYQKDTHNPKVDFDALSYGDLSHALLMDKIDRFKFVLGFDLTLLTNMFSSLQIIRDNNMDYSEFHADFATMMLSNGFNTAGAVKSKEFYSLYFSKPFGVSGQHRWNNMTMYEGGDGWWNWFTIGFGMTDNIEATFETNHYWGTPNTQFGQLQNSNNVQIGFKYNF
jgi:hypothetical protein